MCQIDLFFVILAVLGSVQRKIGCIDSFKSILDTVGYLKPVITYPINKQHGELEITMAVLGRCHTSSNHHHHHDHLFFKSWKYI